MKTRLKNNLRKDISKKLSILLFCLDNGTAGDMREAKLLPSPPPPLLLVMVDEPVPERDRELSGVMVPRPDESRWLRIIVRRTSPGRRLCNILWKSSRDISFDPIPFIANTLSLNLDDKKKNAIHIKIIYLKIWHTLRCKLK